MFFLFEKTVVSTFFLFFFKDKTSSQQKDHIPVYDLGLLKFLENVLHYSDLILRIRTKLLNHILAERNNTIPHLNRRQMRNCLRILIEVDVRPQHSRVTFYFFRWKYTNWNPCFFLIKLHPNNICIFPEISTYYRNVVSCFYFL